MRTSAATLLVALFVIASAGCEDSRTLFDGVADTIRLN
jgi:hypothetical protein